MTAQAVAMGRHQAALLALTCACLLATASAAACDLQGYLDLFPAGMTSAPQAWTRPNQTLAGNAGVTGLLPIALYGVPNPTLMFQPTHWSLTAGCAPVSPSRKLQVAATVVTPASFNVSWAIDGGAPTRAGPFTSGSAPLNITFSVFALGLTSGLHTIRLNVTIANGTGELSDCTAVPAADVLLTQQVQFYKLTTPYEDKPTVNKLTWTSGPNVTMTISNLWPKPVLVGAQTLFAPVYHVWGRYVRGFDGQPYAGDDTANNAQLHFFDAYWAADSASANTLTLLNPNLADGYYSMNFETSLTSDLPSLMSLAGGDTFKASNVPFLGIDAAGSSSDANALVLTGRTKYNGYLSPSWNATLMCIQRSSVARFVGPQGTIKVNQSATFSWDFVGNGTTSCLLDGKPFVTDASGACSTAQQGSVTLKVAEGGNHTLAVTFTNICNSNLTNTFKFGAGYAVVTDAVCADCGGGAGGGLTGSPRPLVVGNGAGRAAAPSGGVLGLAGAALAALAAAWLL